MRVTTDHPKPSYARSMDKEPLVSIVRGTPTDEELAALVAVLSAASTTANANTPRPSMSAWSRAARPSMGPASWRTSTLPQ
jgi:hypothetical protein